MMGKELNRNKKMFFPLLFKVIDASDKLSVQVHPDDGYAQKVEGEPGKTEMWYIIDAEDGAKLIYGVKAGTSKKDFARAIREGSLEKYLNEVEVNKGDIFFIPSGAVHAIKGGILLAEIQQNSDTTYRVYDWNRMGRDGKPRDLHIEKAVDVINFNLTSAGKNIDELVKTTKNYTRKIMAVCPYFTAEKIAVKKFFALKPAQQRFYIIMNLNGQGMLKYQGEKYPFKKGMTYFIPASLNKVKVTGKLEMLSFYLPLSKDKITNELRKIGFSREEIEKTAGYNLNW